MSNERATGEYCRATRRDGSPCQGRALPGSPYCFAHSAATTETRRKGGQSRSNAVRSLKAMPERLKPVADLLTAAMAKTFRGDMSPPAAAALAALASAYVRVLTAGEMELRMRNLEQLAHDAEAGA